MINIKKEGILLQKTMLGFESQAVLNPAVIKGDNCIHMFYRAVNKDKISSIGYCKLSSPLEVSERSLVPVLSAEALYESWGVEDPRISRIDNLYYLSYTAYDGFNALGALALSSDLKHFERRGIIVPKITYSEFKSLAESKGAINQKYLRYNEPDNYHTPDDKKVFIWDKNVIFFPRRINGKLYFLHRIRPDILIASVNQLEELTPEFWQNYFLYLDNCIVLSPKYNHEISYIGGGCPPIETAHGWLMIYHGVFDSITGYVYTGCAALLDLENPGKEIARLPYPVFIPEFEWELIGEVNNVCFPTGSVVEGDRLYIYYGAADEQIACVSLSMTELLDELLLNAHTNEQ